MTIFTQVPKRNRKPEDRTKTYRIYWLHLANDTDPYTEGYIGLTSQVINQRISKHKYDIKNEPDKKISKWLSANIDTFIVTVLHEGAYDEMALMERTYRPHDNISLNSYGGRGGRRIASSEIMRTKINVSNHSQIMHDYHAIIKQIREEHNCGYMDAIAIYKATHGLHQDRRNARIRMYAQEHNISFSEARRQLSIETNNKRVAA